MQMINVRVSGLSEINMALKEIGSTAQIKGAAAGTLAAARIIQKQAKNMAPVDRSSHPPPAGTLKKNIIIKRWRRDEGKGKFLYLVGPRQIAWYGRLVERGVRRHDIYPRSEIKERLRWGKEGGKLRGQFKRKPHGKHGLGKDGKFGQHVRHPGFQARRWLEKSFDLACVQAIDGFAANYARAAFRLGVLETGHGARYVAGRYVGVELPLITGI